MKKTRFTEEQVIRILKAQESGQKTLGGCFKRGEELEFNKKKSFFCKKRAKDRTNKLFLSELCGFSGLNPDFRYTSPR